MGVKKPASFAGQCKKCQVPFNSGQEVCMHNNNGQWIICSNEECFKSQGGTIDEQKQGGRFESKKFSYSQVDEVYQKAEDILTKFLTNRKGGVLQTNEQAVFIESIFRSIVTGFKP